MTAAIVARVRSNQGFSSLRVIQIKTRVNSLMAYADVNREKWSEAEKSESERESVCKEMFVPLLLHARGYKVEARWDAELPTFSPFRGCANRVTVSMSVFSSPTLFFFFLKTKRPRFRQQACNNAARFVSADELLQRRTL